MWWNKYIGIPYLDKGRDQSGVDCWGLARLVYSNEFNITLPSFYSNYSNNDPDGIKDLISQYTEGWCKEEAPGEGTLVLFRVLGLDSHIGVMISDKEFIHSREGKDVVIESIESGAWKHRVSGFYKYNKTAGAILAAVPHPLKTERIDMHVPAGITVGELLVWIAKEKEIPAELVDRVIILIDGTPIDIQACKDLILQPGQRLEYRALPGKSAMRLILTVAVMAFAQWAAPALAGVTTAQAAAGGLAAFKLGVAQAALSLVGSALVNAIFPVRPPAGPADPGTSNPQLAITGGRNEARPYGAVPVVLGQYRYAAALAASNYMVTNSDIAYLKMLMIWGYGPLSIQDMRIGANPVDTYDDVTTITVYGNGTETAALEAMHSLYGPDTYQESPALPLTYTGTPTDWITRRISTQKVNSISVTLHFPEGLRGIYREGKLAGTTLSVAFRGEVQIQELDDALAPVGSWKGINSGFSTTTFSLPQAQVIVNSYEVVYGNPESGGSYIVDEYGPAYQWHRIVYTSNGVLSLISGPMFATFGATTVPVPTGSWVDTNPNNGGYYATEDRSTLPVVNPNTQYIVHDILVYDTAVHSSNTTYRTISITGAALTTSGLSASVASGTLDATLIEYGLSGEPFYLRKDAFSTTINFGAVPRAYYDVRVRRTTTDDAEAIAGGSGNPIQYVQSSWYLLTGSNTNLRAVIQPVGVNFAMTSMYIKATDQLNGSIESINALVTSICYDYTGTPGSWVTRPTRNPASLFRYILQHPGNAQRVLDGEVSAKIDLTKLEEWHTYCSSKGYMFDAVISEQRSLLDILRDIAAAGRASPLLVGGKWTVVIDQPRSNIIQHFTPHNSYGFEGTKNLTVVPHALRVNFINSLREYQAEELIVYNDRQVRVFATTTLGSPNVVVNSTVGLKIGSSIIVAGNIPLDRAIASITDATNLVLTSGIGVLAGTSIETFFATKYDYSDATIFEALELPGVTVSTAAYSHARFHLGQAKLRPEIYSLNTDMEHIVCTRGDLVRVTHDVPMWGISSGRIKSRPTSTTILLYEPVNLVTGNTYNIRIRTATNTSVTRTLTTIVTSGQYTTLTLTASVTVDEAETDNLFMLGINSQESNELIVLSIEPSNNLTAKITLVDYSTKVYDLDNKLIPAFETKIQQPPQYARNFILKAPIVTEADIRSDESVMELAGASYVYKIVVPFKNPANMGNNITHVEARIDLVDDTSISWRHTQLIPLNEGKVTIRDVEEGLNYAIQLRYVSGIGFTGPWTAEFAHIVVGKTNPPGNVGTITVSTESTGIHLSWPKNLEVDLAGYEIRLGDYQWGEPGALYVGTDISAIVSPPPTGVSRTWYIRAFDSANPTNYSVASSTGTITLTGPGAPTSIIASFTQGSALFKWQAPVSSLFPVVQYRLTLVAAGMATITAVRNTTDWEVPVTWTGTATLTIVPEDLIGQTYTGGSNTITLTKANPSTPSIPVQTFSNTNIFLDWVDNTISGTQLEVVSYEIKEGSTSIWRGSTSQATISLLEKSGTLNYNLYAIDYEGYTSAARAISINIPVPTNINNDATFAHSFGNSLTDSSLTLQWANVTPVTGLSGYEITYDSVVTTTQSNTLTISPLPSAWIGNKTFTIKTVDLLGNKSTGTSKIIAKSLPLSVPSYNAQVIDNNVMIYWTLPTRTSLPVAYILVKKGATWGSAEEIGRKDGTFTTVFERAAGVYTYWLATVDTDGQESTPVSLSVAVSAPPDFIFNDEATSTFTVGAGVTFSNALKEESYVVLPVNTTKTYAQHFIDANDGAGPNTWATPQAQIDAGYPVYIQPSETTGYYEEIFDLNPVPYASSQITLTYTGSVVSGAVTVITNLTYSSDGISYSPDFSGSSLFGSNIRFVKARITVSQTDSGHGIYKLTYLNIRLDAKIKSDSGAVVCTSTHTDGTMFNFNVDFVDVSSITLTPSGTTRLTAVYDFKDTIVAGTYSVTSNVCTVTATAHGFSQATGAVGQKVKLSFNTGTAPNGTYAIVTVPNANTFTVALTTANTSGNVSVYPEGARVYLFDAAGARATGTVSWAVRGY